MATFTQQVDSLAGSSSGTNAVQWFNDGVKDVINRFAIVNPNILPMFATQSADLTGSSTTLDLSSAHRVISVFRRNSNSSVTYKTARQIAVKDRFKASDSTSLLRATEENPVYYIRNQTLNVLPLPTNSQTAHADVVQTTELGSLSGSSISNFPSEYYRLPVLYASMKLLHVKMVGHALPSDLSISSAPSIPSAPSFTAPNGAIQNAVGAMSFSLTGTAPVFTPPVMEDVDTSAVQTFIDDDDIELARSQVEKISAQVQKFNADLASANQKFQEDNVEYQAKVQKDIQQFTTDANRAIQLMQTSTNVDLQNKAQVLQKEVGEYTATLNRYGQDLARFSADVQADVQEHSTKLAKEQLDYEWKVRQYQTLRQEYESAFVPYQPPKEEKQDG